MIRTIMAALALGLAVTQNLWAAESGDQAIAEHRLQRVRFDVDSLALVRVSPGNVLCPEAIIQLKLEPLPRCIAYLGPLAFYTDVPGFTHEDGILLVGKELAATACASRPEQPELVTLGVSSCGFSINYIPYRLQRADDGTTVIEKTSWPR